MKTETRDTKHETRDMENGMRHAFSRVSWLVSRVVPLLLLAPPPVSAADLTTAVDCVADARQLDSLFARYPSPTTQRILREGTGVRFVLPAVTQTIPQTGLYSYFSVAGDFEIGANYELLSMSKPIGGYGVSCGLAIDAEGTGMVSIARGESVGKSSGYVVTRGKLEDGETKYDSTFYPSTAKAGRLVLRREKADVICLAADTPKGEPQELVRLPFTAGTVHKVRIYADLGGSHTSMDVRMNDLQIRAVEIAGGQPKYEPPRPWSWWWWAGLGGVGVLAVGLVGFRFRAGRWPFTGGDD
jgi:hypothetical protein